MSGRRKAPPPLRNVGVVALRTASEATVWLSEWLRARGVDRRLRVTSTITGRIEVDLFQGPVLIETCADDTFELALLRVTNRMRGAT